MNQWQFCIEINLCIADKHYSSRFISKLEYFSDNKNIKKTYLLDIQGQTDLWLNYIKLDSDQKHLVNFTM